MGQRAHFCECGQEAVHTVDLRIGPQGSYAVRLHLCARCMLIEEETRELLRQRSG